jgi:hypothetical protein
MAFSPQTKYTDWSIATGRRILVPTFVNKEVSRCQSAGNLTAVNLSFLDRSYYILFLSFFFIYPHEVEWTPFQTRCWKSGSAGNRTRDLWACSQELWPLDHSGGPSNLSSYLLFILVLSGEECKQRYRYGLGVVRKTHGNKQYNCDCSCTIGTGEGGRVTHTDYGPLITHSHPTILIRILILILIDTQTQRYKAFLVLHCVWTTYKLYRTPWSLPRQPWGLLRTHEKHRASWNRSNSISLAPRVCTVQMDETQGNPSHCGPRRS